MAVSIANLLSNLEDNFLFILALSSEIQSGRLKIPSDVNLYDPIMDGIRKVSFDPISLETAIGLTGQHIMQTAFTSSVALSDHWLENGKKSSRPHDVQRIDFSRFSKSDDSDFDGVRIMLFQMRNAWIQNPDIPTWNIQKEHRFEVKSNLESQAIHWKGQALEGKPASLNDIGGWYGFLDILQFLKTKVPA